MPRSYNILFLVVDDLRTSLGCYGDPMAITPNIDRLAARGMVFQRAYCQQAVCNPSRSSMMTGRRPDTIAVWDLGSGFREDLPEKYRDLPQFSTGTHFRSGREDLVTLPQFFKNQGYFSTSVGKVYHGSPVTEDPESWSEPAFGNLIGKKERGLLYYATEENQKDRPGSGHKRGSTECADVPDNAYIDGIVAEEACKKLQTLATMESPFFLAVGFRKPHIPFCAPKRYWDLYDREALARPANPDRPSSAPDVALHDNRELRGYWDIPSEGPISPEKTAELRHGYYACVSYTDALIGQVLDELDRLGLADNTIISLYGDHGYHLGEKGLWCKTTNYELDTNAPLMLSLPGPGQGGQKTGALCEFVDLYPTLVEAAGFNPPEGLEGTSLMPLMTDPGRPWKTAAFSQFPRPWRYNGEPEVMGYSMRTERYRYTEWQSFRSREVLARELYDHTSDSAEIRNLAGDAGVRSIMEDLSLRLKAGWTAALPPK